MNSMPFFVFWWDYVRSNLGIISGLGIICAGCYTVVQHHRNDESS